MAISKLLSENVFSKMNMPSATTVVSTAASVAASAMVIRSIARDLVPYELQQYVFSSIRTLFRSFSSDIVLIVEEFDGLVRNQIYKAADIYLGTKIYHLTQVFKVTLPEKETKITTKMAKNQEIVDVFKGVQFKWKQITTQVEIKRTSLPGQASASNQTEVRYFALRFNKKHKQMVFDSYFPYVLTESNKIKEEKKTLKIHTLNSDHYRRYSGPDHSWTSVNLDHPATFATLAMDPELKKMVMDDLERFVKRKEFYREVGKAWKRGYLLYGPPGTGKSSLIAAMANYLHFDIYDLELTDIQANSELRRLLIATANRSILVVEDIDCSLDFDDRQDEEKMLKILKSNQISKAQTVNITRNYKPSSVTLSGLLNFIDGLWSSCGDERIIVFTTNHKDRLDPALLRPGRMDVHIHMSYCTPCGFKTLAANYLHIVDHSVFPEIEDLLGKTSVTPAEVGEHLLKNEDPQLALAGLIEFIKDKKIKAEETEAKKAKEKQEEESRAKELKEKQDHDDELATAKSERKPGEDEDVSTSNSARSVLFSQT